MYEMNGYNYEAGNQQSLYSITIEEFIVPAPTIPKPYDITKRIGRETLISMWIDSFKKSRGSPNSQLLFMDWLIENNGLDYRKTMKNWADSGYCECLSSEEQSMFLSTFRRVRNHVVERGTPQEYRFSDKEIIAEFNLYIDIFSNPESDEHNQFGLPQPQVDEPLKGMSKQRLIDIINQHKYRYLLK